MQPSALPQPVRGDQHGGLFRALLHGLYDAAWLLGLVLGSPWLAVRCLKGAGFRRMVVERLRPPAISPPRPGDRPRVLVHGVSVGEIKAALALVQSLERDRPDLEVVLSTTTTTGQAMARKLFPGHALVRFPADLSFLVSLFLRRVRPEAVVLIELEVWPNFLRIANRHGVPVAVVNGRITAKSYDRYRWFRRLLPQFDRISLYCAQSDAYAARFVALGVRAERVHVTGNIKVDGLHVGRLDPGDELRARLGAAKGQAVLVAGSTHEPEELLLVEAWRASGQGARLVLVPRHPERAPDVQRALFERGVEAELLTELRQQDAAGDPARVAIADTIGELERLYALSDLAFVGGSLVAHGGQNVLEPAAQGVPVLVGPHVHNFRQEVALLVECGACRKVADGRQLAEVLGELLMDPARSRAMGQAGLAAVASQRGATQATWRVLERSQVLPAPRAGAGHARAPSLG